MLWRALMSCPRAHQRKDYSHDEISKDSNASRSGGYCRCRRLILERKLHPRHVWSRNGGSGHYRPATDTYELRRSRAAYRKTVRGGRLLLLEGASAGTTCTGCGQSHRSTFVTSPCRQMAGRVRRSEANPADREWAMVRELIHALNRSTISFQAFIDSASAV
jgi:hypothetical protein